MKKTTFILIISFFSLAQLCAQTIVNTFPENRKLILEEFGGIYCVYCPDGNEIAASILATYPGEVFRINVHGGFWANPEPGDPDFATMYSDAFINESGLIGYPAGTVNRLNFSELEQGNLGTTALSRWNWEAAITQALGEQAVVNVAATSTINYTTNEMEILVEMYYTGSSEASTNYLNIAVLQNNIHAPQAGSDQGNNYLHHSLLRDMITGQWGLPITNTSAGHFESRSFTYPLPNNINGVPLDPPNIELIVFVTESHQNILNATSVNPDYIVANALDANALFLEVPEVICGSQISPIFTLRNDGNETLTSLFIDYQINQEPVQTFEWTGALNTFESTTIPLPSLFIEDLMDTENCLSITVHQPNGNIDQDLNNNSICRTFQSAPASTSAIIKLELKTDDFGFDIYWEVTDEFDNIIASGGNETVAENGGGTQMAQASDPGAYGNNENITKYIELPNEGCYTFTILDDFGDGLCCQYGFGFFYLEDESGNVIFSGSEFSGEQKSPFSYSIYTTVNENTAIHTSLKLFPNPVTKGKLFFEIDFIETESLTIELFSSNLRKQYQATETISPLGTFQGNIDVSLFPSGVYFLKLTTKKGSISKKVIVQ